MVSDWTGSLKVLAWDKPEVDESECRGVGSAGVVHSVEVWTEEGEVNA